jgi:hypothetical protein
MTTISQNRSRAESLWSPEDMRPRRIVRGENIAHLVLGKPRQLTSEEKADLAQRDALYAKMAAASEKQRLEVEKSNHYESHEMYLSNISHMSLDGAKKSLGITQVMIERHSDAGLNVHGRYGDTEISDLKTYLAALKDFIGKQKTAMPTAPTGTSTVAAPTPSSTAAASTYRQVQDMVNKSGSEG